MTPEELEATPHYSFVPVGERAIAAIARFGGRSICNSGVVDLGEGALVFDTGMTPGSALDLETLAVRVCGAPPTLAANSHWHMDHVLGNQTFGKLPIWGTRRTREILLERREELSVELTKEKLEADLHDLERRRASAVSSGVQRDLEFWIQIQRAVLSAVDELRLTPPTHTFDTHLALPGARKAVLRSFGAGHTEADALLVLPEEKLVFAGDLVLVGMQPSMGSGDPRHWLTVLDEIERLGPERIVPGHGPLTDAKGISETRAYLTGVLEAAEAPEGRPLPSSIARWEGTLSLDENLKFARRWLSSPEGSGTTA